MYCNLLLSVVAIAVRTTTATMNFHTVPYTDLDLTPWPAPAFSRKMIARWCCSFALEDSRMPLGLHACSRVPSYNCLHQSHHTTAGNGSTTTPVLRVRGGVSIKANVSSPLLRRAMARYTALVELASPHSPAPIASTRLAAQQRYTRQQQEEAAQLAGGGGGDDGGHSRFKTVEGAVELQLNVADASEELIQSTDESYELRVLVDGAATATATTVFGALRAMESWSQLFEQAGDGGDGGGVAIDLQLRGLPWHIRDAPRFAHRGMLVDTARHYLPISTLQQHIDGMAYTKLNLLHLHLVDFQSFPFASTQAPLLVQGAYSPNETYVAFTRDPFNSP
jgi:hypothetical protein